MERSRGTRTPCQRFDFFLRFLSFFAFLEALSFFAFLSFLAFLAFLIFSSFFASGASGALSGFEATLAFGSAGFCAGLARALGFWAGLAGVLGFRLGGRPFFGFGRGDVGQVSQRPGNRNMAANPLPLVAIACREPNFYVRVAGENAGQ